MIFSWRAVPKGGGVVFGAFPQLPCLAKLCCLPVRVGCAKQAEISPPYPPPATWGEHVSLFWMWCSLSCRETGPNDISFQQVSGCHEEAETVNLLLLPVEARNISMVGGPGVCSTDWDVLCGGEQHVLTPWWGLLPPRDVLIFPALFFCDLPNLLGSYTQWVHLGVAQRGEKKVSSSCWL